MPSETVSQFEQEVAAGQRSALIAALLDAWLEGRHREALHRQIVQGCQDMWDTYLEIEKEYHPLEEEAEHQFHD